MAFFRRSCLINILEFLQAVTNYIDQGLLIDVIYLDFQKAFDEVHHKRLMLKAKSLGITGIVFDRIKV
jgi:ribonuclease P/MRP protein subunit RPP40